MNKLFTKIVGAFLGLTMAVGVGVAVASKSNSSPVNAADSTYTLGTIPTTGWTTSGGTKAINGISWTYDSSTYIGADGKIQVGSKNKPQTTAWHIKTAISNFGSGKVIKSVTLSAYTTATSATYDITVGSTSVKSGSLTTSTANYTASSLSVSSGNIDFTLTGSSTSKAMYITGISVTYGDSVTPSTFTVTYNGNGNTSGSVPTDSGSYSSGATVTVLGNTGSLAKTNCEFLGWNTNQNATTAQYVAGNTFSISSNTILYAIWNQTSFPVTYNKNGGTGTMTDSNSPYNKNATVTVLDNSFTAPSGKEFANWNTKANGTGESYDPGDTFSITETTILYAQWSTVVDDGSHITWDLKTNSFASSDTDEVVWQGNTKISFTLVTGQSTTPANNYLGGVDNHNMTKFYNQQVLTFSVLNENVKITSIVVTASTSGYATNLQSSSWTNATAAIDGTTDTKVNITPNSGKGTYGNDISAIFGSNASNYHEIQITYAYIPKISVSPTSIVVEANGTNTTTLSYDYFDGSEVPTITAAVTSGTVLTASAVSQSGTTITVTAGANTGIVVFTLTGTISAQSATTTLTVEVVASIIAPDHISVEEGSSVVTYKGTDKALTITVLGANEEEASNQNVTCTSSNTSILTVTNAGVITPKAKGVATVTILDQDELCDPVVINIRVREKTTGDAKEIGVLDMTDYSKTSEGATIASSHYTAKNSFASPTGMSLADNYYAEGSCVRLGKSGGAGSITITFASVKVARVDVKAKLYSGDSGLLTVTNGSTTGSFSDSAYNTVSYSLSSSVSSITITAAGKPRFYVESVTLYSERVDITSESDTQACYTFEETYMHLDDYNSNLGYCNDVSHNYYGKNTDSGAKAHFNSLSADQRSLFTSNETFADAWARLQAWADANGESLNGSNQLAAGRSLPITSIIGENTNTIALIVVITMISATAIGGYFFLRKRKEN